MIVKPSALLNTHFLKMVLNNPAFKSLTLEDIDQPIGWSINIGLLDDMQHIDVPVAIVDGTGQIPDGGVNGITTAFIDTGEPAILLYVTNTSPDRCVASVLVHEYRHATQVRDGRLSFKDDNLYWMGEKQPAVSMYATEEKYRNAMSVINKLRYMAQPWEMEADHMVRSNALPSMVFHRLITRYGTTWPVHWSPVYVAKRFYALGDWRLVIEELYNEGF